MNVTYIVLGNNSFTGRLPQSWFNSTKSLNKLNFLDISSNSLTGTIPSLQYLIKLGYAVFADNQFVGT